MRWILLIMVLLIGGCAQNANQKCESPLVEIGGMCCEDSDSNKICDDVEIKEETKIEEKQEQVPTEIVPSKQFISIEQLEASINKSHSPIKKYSFEDLDRENLSEFEQKYDIRTSDRYVILEMREDRHFLNTAVEFADFMKRKHELDAKNTKILATSAIDYNQLVDESWQKVTYSYEYDIDSLSVTGFDDFIEWHLLNYDNEGDSVDIYLEYKISVWCTPSLVVEVHPDENSGFYNFEHSYSKSLLAEATKLMEEEKQEMMDKAKIIRDICDGKDVEGGLKPGEIVFHGTLGFTPNEIKIKAGERITIYNENDRWIGTLFMIKRDKPHKIILSPMIELGEIAEVKIPEVGVYSMFSEQFNPTAKIIVE